ncbi:27143_t:CDS:2, partial [Dentiscutata erythropus]
KSAHQTTNKYEESFKYASKPAHQTTDRYEESFKYASKSAHQPTNSNDAFDRIRYSAHVVTINDEFKTWNNVDGLQTSQLRLFSLLKKQKDIIDHILDSYTVYAVGPDFQNDFSIPHIACWVANPLTKSVMEKISDLFNHEFEVAYHLMSNNDGNSNNTTNANGDISGGFSTTTRNVVEHEETKENDGNSDDGDDDDDSEYYDANDEGIVGFEDKKLIDTYKKKFQSFNITIKLWANVKLDSKNNVKSTLEFEIDLIHCNATDFLSEQCPSLNCSICYYIDSLDVCVSPIPINPDDTSTLIITKKKHSPRKANNDISFTKVQEKDGRLQLDVGAPQNIKASFSGGRKKGRSLTATIKEWAMWDTFSEITGDKWSYKFADSDICDTIDNRVSIDTDVPYKGHWYITNEVKGFRVTIRQVLGSTSNKRKFRYMKTPELIKSNPKLVHQLEISFMDIKRFDSDFKEHVKKKLHRSQPITITPKNNSQPQQENNEEFISRKLFT